MKFWDTSAILPLLVRESSTTALRRLARADSDIIVWWGTYVECVSAFARRERDGSLNARQIRTALRHLESLAGSWYVIEPLPVLRSTACRLVRTHELRAADALQLAAAICAAEHRPSTLPFVCLDRRLCDAALREGLPLLPD
jgi:predicted nucleic acid-binding protein